MATTADKLIILDRLEQAMQRIKSEMPTKTSDLTNDSGFVNSNLQLGHAKGTCGTAAGTAAKVVNLSNYVLATYGYIAVKFTYNVPANATLNVNSTGPKSIYYKGAAITADVIQAGDTALLQYNGTQYDLLSVDRAAFGAYVKPSGGIPASDMTQEVQDALSLAGTYVLDYNGNEQSGTIDYNGVSVTPSDIHTVADNGKDVVLNYFNMTDKIAYLVDHSATSAVFIGRDTVTSGSATRNRLAIFNVASDGTVTRSYLVLPEALSDLTNDAGFITNTVSDLTNYYTKTQVDNLVSTIPIFSIEVVNSLPTTDISDTTIYLVRDTSSGTNQFTEYIHVNNNWEMLGTQELDLSNYATKVSGATSGNFAGLDANGNLTDSGKKPADFVLAVTGKGLSTEDYTTAEKTKLSGIATGATKTESSTTNGNIKINGVETTVYTPPANMIVGTVATQTEVGNMLDDVFGASS